MSNSQRHAERGYYFLNTFEPLESVARRIRYHHVPWNYGEGIEGNDESIPFSSHIINLADRVAISLDRSKPILNQVEGIQRRIQDRSGSLFVPEIVNAFMNLSTKEYFWFDLASPASSITVVISETLAFHAFELTMTELIDFGNLIRRIIDFRAPFTASHSLRVAFAAEALARNAGFSKREQKMIKVAGYLHDLGKLAVPAEILRKPGKLTKSEFNLVKRHTFYSYRALEPLKELYTINAWASFHHERMDGKGYPFKHKGAYLPLGSRIMSVADTFAALTEARPYRQAYNVKCIGNYTEYGCGRGIGPGYCCHALQNADEIYSICVAAGIS